jgi:hypothetical protein
MRPSSRSPHVENVTGRGYVFIAPVTRHEETRVPEPAAPVPLTRMIGRDAIFSTLASRLARARSLCQRLLKTPFAGVQVILQCALLQVC